MIRFERLYRTKLGDIQFAVLVEGPTDSRDGHGHVYLRRWDAADDRTTLLADFAYPDHQPALRDGTILHATKIARRLADNPGADVERVRTIIGPIYEVERVSPLRRKAESVQDADVVRFGR